nr:hypothetical protein Iba_chr04bCG13870 [Ipomoea batatas]GMC83227.1 hypothetical protein Iba_chr04cCG0100 [Ipomoea batatas]
MSDIEPVQKFVSCISDAHLAIRELEVDVKTLGNGFCQKCQNQLKEPHVCFYDADHVLKTEEVLFYVDKGFKGAQDVYLVGNGINSGNLKFIAVNLKLGCC